MSKLTDGFILVVSLCDVAALAGFEIYSYFYVIVSRSLQAHNVCCRTCILGMYLTKRRPSS
jgi:hypothetical protein